MNLKFVVIIICDHQYHCSLTVLSSPDITTGFCGVCLFVFLLLCVLKGTVALRVNFLSCFFYIFFYFSLQRLVSDLSKRPVQE